MGTLSDTEFLQHQAFLGSGFAGLALAQTMVESGLALVVASTDIGVEVDMLNPYAINAETVNVDATANLLALAARALEGHITGTTGQTFNDYLFVRGLKVSQNFADLSAILGATIAPANIE